MARALVERTCGRRWVIEWASDSLTDDEAKRLNWVIRQRRKDGRRNPNCILDISRHLSLSERMTTRPTFKEDNFPHTM